MKPIARTNACVGGIASLLMHWAIFCLLACSVPAAAMGLDGQRIVAVKSLDLLPTEIAPLFERRRDELLEFVVEPDTVWRHNSAMRERLLWHRVGMDAAAEETTSAARLAAAEAFPIDRIEAKKLFRRNDVRGGSGELCWAIEELYLQLVTAFRSAEEMEIVRAAGHLAHFAAGAASPFNVTVNFDGKQTGNLHLGRVNLGHPDYAHRDIDARITGELIRRNQVRYAAQIVLAPGEYDPISEPLTRSRPVLMASLGLVEPWTTADREIVSLMEIADGRALRSRADEYYVLLDQHCGEDCVDRLREGSIFAANLIGGAWAAAGKPSIELIRARNGGVPLDRTTGATQDRPMTTVSSTAANPPPMAAGAFVGSRNSNVFHKAGCKFADQISPDNLVYFTSPPDAKEQGRRACRVCKPD